MKTIKVLGPISKNQDEAEKHLASIFKNYKTKKWGNGLHLEIPKSRKEIISYIEILLINFWQSFSRLPSDCYVHSDFSYPRLDVKTEKDHLLVSWEQELFLKNKKNGNRPRNRKT